MKNYLFIGLGLSLLVGCNQSEFEETKLKLAQANYENDSLRTVAVEQENTVNEFISFFNKVERNLDSVTINQNIITLNKSEFKKDQKQRINEAVSTINSLMNANYNLIGDLKKKLKNSGYKNLQLEKTIAVLNDQLIQKEAELADLKTSLGSTYEQIALLESAVDTLRAENNSKTNDLAATTTALHTSYYVIGKSKELEASNIIDKKGGLLGIGKTAKLGENLDKSSFTKIDYLEMKKIPIWGYGVKIVTSHPTDSYVLEKDFRDKTLFRELVIKDPEEFWGASKYLVIVKN